MCLSIIFFKSFYYVLVFKDSKCDIVYLFIILMFLSLELLIFSFESLNITFLRSIEPFCVSKFNFKLSSLNKILSHATLEGQQTSILGL